MLNNSKSYQENNEILKKNNEPSYEDTLKISFRDRKKVYFNVNFGSDLSFNQKPYFSTSSDKFNRNRSGYESSGQCQDKLIKNKYLLEFYKKWNKFHFKTLNLDELNQLKKDVELLMEKVNYVENDDFNVKINHDRLLSK